MQAPGPLGEPNGPGLRGRPEHTGPISLRTDDSHSPPAQLDHVISIGREHRPRQAQRHLGDHGVDGVLGPVQPSLFEEARAATGWNLIPGGMVAVVALAVLPVLPRLPVRLIRTMVLDGFPEFP